MRRIRRINSSCWQDCHFFERQTFFLSQAVDEVQRKHFPGVQPLVFHASEMRSRRNYWRKFDREKIEDVLEDLVETILQSPAAGRFLYAGAVEKSDRLWGDDAVEKATEVVCRQFDRFLRRRFHQYDDAQRGLLVFSEGRFDARARVWVRDFQQQGRSWGTMRNLADIPYFASTKKSRLLQLADLVAHAVWIFFEKKDPRWIRPLLPLFATESEGRLDGLVHVQPDPAVDCDCPACRSRVRRGDFGAWV